VGVRRGWSKLLYSFTVVQLEPGFRQNHRCTDILSVSILKHPTLAIHVSHLRLLLCALVIGLPSSMAEAVLVVCLCAYFLTSPLNLTLMSHANPTTSSSPNFQLIFNNALETYKKRTKNDLLAHPLVIQFQNCTSSGAVLALVQQQAQGLQRDDDRLTKWLDPTVRVLQVFSETLGEGVSLVCLRK
jgi:hypothetical protein